MDALEFFLRDHALVHSARVAAAEHRSMEDIPLRDLQEEHLRARPHGLNSLAWLLWHMARCEDVAVNLVAAQRAQVFDEGEWAERLRVARRDVGTAMTGEEVAALSAEIDLEAVREYRAAVGRRTREVAQALPLETWAETLDGARIARAGEQGAFGPGAEWLERFWTGKSVAWLFYWLACGHNYLHLGQARWVRKLLLGEGQA